MLIYYVRVPSGTITPVVQEIRPLAPIRSFQGVARRLLAHPLERFPANAGLAVEHLLFLGGDPVYRMRIMPIAAIARDHVPILAIAIAPVRAVHVITCGPLRPQIAGIILFHFYLICIKNQFAIKNQINIKN